MAEMKKAVKVLEEMLEYIKSKATTLIPEPCPHCGFTDVDTSVIQEHDALLVEASEYESAIMILKQKKD